ncbi:MAG TPA: hypothetical protein VFF69_07680 [Phycisphaerales bacterium]|nr:hypothetical protein [Phycisphaerales bacterium]
MDAPGGRRAIVWVAEDRVEFLRAVARAADLRVVGAGSPVKGKSGSIAAALGCGSVDDLRSALTEGECELVLVGSPGDFGAASAPSDAAAVLAARQRGVRVVTLDPLPASALELAGGWSSVGLGGVRAVDAARLVPLARCGRSFRDAREVREMFGPARTLLVEVCCRPDEGSLGACLFSALDVLVWLMGDPESVDAAYATARRGPLVALPGESLRDAHGDITANCRFADGRAAAILASDQSGRWSRNLTMLGDAGRLRIYDDGFEWVSAAGERVDASRQTKRRGETPELARSVEAAADAVTRLLDPAVPEEGPIDHAAVLAACQAVLLSTRTGSSESPATIRRMMEVG